jgi:membrane-associated protease RseP (regulator of RpoE activity)
VSAQDFSSPDRYYAADGAAIEAAPQERAHERYWLYGLLFAVTLCTTTIVGASMQADFDRGVPFDIVRSLTMYERVWRHPAELLRGLPFSLTLMAILLAHEFGHYLAALYHRVESSLPYFMPSPILGTFGAFIRVRSPISSKEALFDIGISGPLAGFVFLMPALSVGLAFSKILPGIAHQGSLDFGIPWLQWLLTKAIFPGVPVGDVCLHPVARAAWVGMLTTAMNLLPIGQLDGGHILYSFFPRRHRQVSTCLSFVLILWPIAAWLMSARYLWWGWLPWGVLLLLLGRRHPAVYDPSALSRGRRRLGWVALLVFILCFCYAPVSEGGF